MGFFDRFSSKKPSPGAAPAAAPEHAAPAPGSVAARLIAAREKLEAKDLPAALAIYEELLAEAGDRADVLVTISGDLGTQGHVAEIIDLVAPRYDAERHGPATGLNILQAYLAVRNADAAQHVLDILFALDRPELEERLYGFSNAVAEILQAQRTSFGSAASGPLPPGAEPPKVGIVTISKPIWFYGLEAMAEQLLPAKNASRLRRVAFSQLALPGAHPDVGEAMKQPENELGRLARAIPLWLAENFFFSSLYSPIAAVGTLTPGEGGPGQPVIFGSEWTTDNLRQMVNTTEGGLDYVFTGALREQAGDYELVLRVWEVKKFRERKTFSAQWTPATADTALAGLLTQVRQFMEWTPAAAALAYTPPASPRAWLETLGASLGFFLAEKNIIQRTLLAGPDAALAHTAVLGASNELAACAFLTLRARAAKMGLPTGQPAPLVSTPLVAQAEKSVAA